jgi:hypothetical protein
VLLAQLARETALQISNPYGVFIATLLGPCPSGQPTFAGSGFSDMNSRSTEVPNQEACVFGFRQERGGDRPLAFIL